MFTQPMKEFFLKRCITNLKRAYTMCQALSRDFPGESAVKNPHAVKETCTGDSGFIPGSGRFPGEANGNPLYSFLASEISWTKEPDVPQSVRHD